MTQSGHERPAFAAMHGLNLPEDLLYLIRDPWPWGKPMRRRDFIAVLGAVASWPLAARAQRPSIPVIGFLDATTAADTVYRVSAFRDGLKEAGFIDGHNVAIEFRWAENKLDRLPALAADLAAGGRDRGPKCLHAGGPRCHLDHTDRVRQRRRSNCKRSRD